MPLGLPANLDSYLNNLLIFPTFWESSEKQTKKYIYYYRLPSGSFIKDMFQASQNLGKTNGNFVPAGFDFTVIQYQRSR